MSDDAQIVDYAMPQTVAKIEGTVSVSTAVTGEKVPVRTSEVSLATEADRDFSTQVDVSGNEWGKRQFDLKFAPDGRLTGATQSSTGLGAEVVATGLRVAALVGKVAAGMLFAIPQQVQQPEPIREILEEEQPELARRRRHAQETIDRLQQRLLALAAELAQPNGGADANELKAVQTAISAARAETTLIEAQFETWRTRRFPDWTTTFSYTIGVPTLPKRDAVVSEITLTREEQDRGQVREVLRTLGVAVVLIGYKDGTQHSDTFTGEGVRYRIPRRVQVAVYEDTDDDVTAEQSPRMHLRRVMPVWIVDGQSEIGFVPFLSGAFKEYGAGVEFGDTGTLSHLTNQHTGAAGAITTALGGTGGAVVESLEQAGKITAALTPPDPALKALQDQVARKELEAKLATAMKTIASSGNGVPAATT